MIIKKINTKTIQSYPFADRATRRSTLSIVQFRRIQSLNFHVQQIKAFPLLLRSVGTITLAFTTQTVQCRCTFNLTDADVCTSGQVRRLRRSRAEFQGTILRASAMTRPSSKLPRRRTLVYVVWIGRFYCRIKKFSERIRKSFRMQAFLLGS